MSLLSNLIADHVQRVGEYDVPRRPYRLLIHLLLLNASQRVQMIFVGDLVHCPSLEKTIEVLEDHLL